MKETFIVRCISTWGQGKGLSGFVHPICKCFTLVLLLYKCFNETFIVIVLILGFQLMWDICKLQMLGSPKRKPLNSFKCFTLVLLLYKCFNESFIVIVLILGFQLMCVSYHNWLNICKLQMLGPPKRKRFNSLADFY